MSIRQNNTEQNEAIQHTNLLIGAGPLPYRAAAIDVRVNGLPPVLQLARDMNRQRI